MSHRNSPRLEAPLIFLPGSAFSGYGSFRKSGVPYFGVLITRILLFRLLRGPLFSEIPISLSYGGVIWCAGDGGDDDNEKEAPYRWEKHR